MKKTLWLSLLACCILGVAGCKLDSSDSKSSDPASSSKSAPGDAEDQEIAKANVYIQVYNSISDYYRRRPGDEFSVSQLAKVRKNRPGKGRYEYLSVPLSLYTNVEKDLSRALAMPGKVAELDEVAQEMQKVVAAALPNMQALETYQNSKKYEDDHGKAGFPMQNKLLDDMDKFDAVQDKLDKQLSVYQKRAHARKLANLKQSGDLPMLNAQEALDEAGAILDIMKDPADFKNAAKVNEANAKLATLEAKNEAMLQEDKKEQSSSNHRVTRGSFEMLHTDFVDFASAYREARKDPEKLGDLIERYNRIIENMNHF